MDESSCAPACLVLKADQATLAESIHRLRVTSTARLPEPLVREGESLAHSMGGSPGGRGEATGGGLSSLFFFSGGMGFGGLLPTILPSASTGDSFTVIPGLESQVTSPLSLVRGDAYDGRYGGLLGELPRGLPGGRLEDPRSRSLGGGTFGDPQDVDGFVDAWDFVTKTGGDPADHSRNNSRRFNVRQEWGGLPSTAPTILGPRYVGGVGIRAPTLIRLSSSIHS
jgi:hypothetical protein